MAAATVTLNTTTLVRMAGVTSLQLQFDSVANITPGICLYIDRELMQVINVLPISDFLGTWVTVRRGQGGTKTTQHAAGSGTVIGRADQFYSTDPVGLPPESLTVSPYINIQNGVWWYALGDDAPPTEANRWYQAQVVTRGITSNGVRTVSVNPPESTAP